MFKLTVQTHRLAHALDNSCVIQHHQEFARVCVDGTSAALPHVCKKERVYILIPGVYKNITEEYGT